MDEVAELNYHNEIKKCKTMDDVLVKNGLMQKSMKDIIQNLLKQRCQSILDEMEIDVPRDRNAEFDPVVVKKYMVSMFHIQ